MIKSTEKFEIVDLEDLSPLDGALDKMESKIKVGTYTLYLLDDKKQRTLSANRYYFGVVLKIIADFMGEKDLEITIDDLHEVLKGKFHKKIILIEGEAYEIGESTKKISQEKFVTYVEAIKSWAWKEFECWIPDPSEVEGADQSDLYIQAYHNYKSK